MINQLLKKPVKNRFFVAAGISLLSVFPIFSFYSNIVSYNNKIKAFRGLETKLNREVQTSGMASSIFIKDLDVPNFKMLVGKDEMFPAASVIKIPLAAAVFAAVKENKLFLSEEIIIRQKDVAGGSGVIKGMKLPLTLTLKEILELMITRSDNTATNKVIDILGYDYIDKSFKALGLKNTALKRKMMDFSRRKKGIENYTSLSDICFLLEKIYNNEFINEESSRIMLTFLEKQKVNDRLPRYLSKKIKVAHKTGLEEGVCHDAGIIFSPKGNYIICVFTKNVGCFSHAKKFIAKISLLTYNFYR